MTPTHTNIFVPTVTTLKDVPAPKNLAARLLAWVVSKDQAYRDQCHMENLSDEALKDVNLKR